MAHFRVAVIIASLGRAHRACLVLLATFGYAWGEEGVPALVGAPHPVLEVRRAERAYSSALGIREEAERLLGSTSAGVEWGPVESVILKDESPFGARPEESCWRVEARKVPIRPADKEPPRGVDLTLVFEDAPSKRLLAVFTTSLEQWALPPRGGWYAASEAAEERLGWTVQVPITTAQKRTVPEVIEAAGRVFGVWPWTVGQMIVRPRFVARRFPLERRGDELVPTRSPAPEWIVEVRGTVLFSQYGYPVTGRLITVSDSNPMEQQSTPMR